MKIILRSRILLGGFTLIELMAAIFISALIFTMIVLGLKTMAHHYRALESGQRIFKEMQINFWGFQEDLANLVPRKVIDQNNVLLPSLMGNNRYIEMTTIRDHLIRRAYFYDDSKKQLIMRTFQVLDRVKPNQYEDKILFNGVDGFKLKYFVNSSLEKTESDVWPKVSKSNNSEGDSPYPDAISVTLSFIDKGAVTRFFLVKKNV